MNSNPYLFFLLAGDLKDISWTPIINLDSGVVEMMSYCDAVYYKDKLCVLYKKFYFWYCLSNYAGPPLGMYVVASWKVCMLLPKCVILNVHIMVTNAICQCDALFFLYLLHLLGNNWDIFSKVLYSFLFYVKKIKL